MYKRGDKVETLDYGTGEIIRVNDDGAYHIHVKNAYVNLFDKEIKPYKSAHDKLIELGYVKTHRDGYVKYDGEKIIIIYDDKTYSCVDTDLELSRILTQYLEELE